VAYTKQELITEVRAAARIFGGERRARLEAAADLIQAGRREHTPQRAILEALDALGIECDSELTLPSTSPRSKSGCFRADIGIYRGDNELVALCECKSWKRELTGRQKEHYDGSGLPYIVAGKDSVDEAVGWLAKMARGNGG
jgi:hypothetical protein